MRYFLPLLCCLWLAPLGSIDAQQTKSPAVVAAFRDTVAGVRDSTVRVLVDDKEAALGAVVSADGWIVSKHSEITHGDFRGCEGGWVFLTGIPDVLTA